MIRINLLPREQRQPEWPLNRIFVLISIVLMAALILVSVSALLVTWHKERQLRSAQNQYELLRPTEVVMSSASSSQQLLNAKNNILVFLTNERKSWPPIITHLAELTTPRVWFTEIGAVDKDTVKVSGMAANYQEVAIFLSRLEQDNLFGEPVLLSAEATPNSMTKFEISVKFKRTKQ